MLEIMPKLLNDKQADELNDRLARIWPSLIADLRKMMRPSTQIAEALDGSVRQDTTATSIFRENSS